MIRERKGDIVIFLGRRVLRGGRVKNLGGFMPRPVEQARDPGELLELTVLALARTAQAALDSGNLPGPDPGRLSAEFNALLENSPSTMGDDVTLLFRRLPETPAGLAPSKTRRPLLHAVLYSLQDLACYIKRKLSGG